MLSLVELENTVADVIGERYPLEFIDIVRASVDALLVVCILDLANGNVNVWNLPSKKDALSVITHPLLPLKASINWTRIILCPLFLVRIKIS